jgi:hypothetical protein
VGGSNKKKRGWRGINTQPPKIWLLGLWSRHVRKIRCGGGTSRVRPSGDGRCHQKFCHACFFDPVEKVSIPMCSCVKWCLSWVVSSQD